MEKTNYEFLCEDLKFMGFGVSLLETLQKSMEECPLSFELSFAHEINDEPVLATLYFNKPDPAGFFFFTKYELVIRDIHHQFPVYKGRGVTVKEGYNLLCGRAVFKQLQGKNGQKYNAWIQLDLTKRENEGFKVNTYHESYGYDLSAGLDGLSIEPPSSNWDRAMLIRSLQKGNLQAAILNQEGESRKVLIEANPAARTITIHADKDQLAQSPVTVEDVHQQSDDVENALGKKPVRARISKSL